jgi:hypothetical protein
MAKSIELTVVMTIVDGGSTLERGLEALANQRGDVRIEVLVPHDHMSRDAAGLAARFPQFRFVDVGEPFGGAAPRNPLEMHRLYDRRRAEGLKLARGRLIGIVEDRGVPAPEWAQAMIRLHSEYPQAVIGGAVINGVDRLRNWAIFFCDFGRYQPPLFDLDPEYVTDTNIVYKREHLMAVRHIWEGSYQEPAVNWALRKSGAGLMLAGDAVTVQCRPRIGLAALARERLHWARMFGQIRGREISWPQRLKLCALMPALPLVLLSRHFRRQAAKGKHIREFVLASPLMLLLLVCWSIGEFVGYLEAGMRRSPARVSPDGEEHRDRSSANSPAGPGH